MSTPLRLSALASIALVASACMPKTSMRVLEPASVDVDPDIQVIGVIDRSRASNAGQTVLGVLEGIVTGETLGADTQGREAAIEAALRVLEESPRFEVARPQIGEAAEGGLFDRELDFRTVKRICRRAGCDALLALEAFDSDSALQIDGITVTSLTNIDQLKRQIADLDIDDVSAQSETTVMASWRLYDADEDVVVDEMRDRTRTYRWQESGSLVDVRRAMPMAGASVAQAGTGIGGDYAARIAPSWQWLTRRYYGGGSPELRSAKRYVKAGDWDGAMRVWEGLLSNPSPRVRGKAEFNLALAHEVQGNFSEALTHARAAAVSLHNGKARGYVFTLEQRQRDDARLAHQMSGPEDADERPPTRSRPERTRPDRSRTVTSSDGSRTTGTMTRPR